MWQSCLGMLQVSGMQVSSWPHKFCLPWWQSKIFRLKNEYAMPSGLVELDQLHVESNSDIFSYTTVSYTSKLGGAWKQWIQCNSSSNKIQTSHIYFHSCKLVETSFSFVDLHGVPPNSLSLRYERLVCHLVLARSIYALLKEHATSTHLRVLWKFIFHILKQILLKQMTDLCMWPAPWVHVHDKWQSWHS